MTQASNSSSFPTDLTDVSREVLLQDISVIQQNLKEIDGDLKEPSRSFLIEYIQSILEDASHWYDVCKDTRLLTARFVFVTRFILIDKPWIITSNLKSEYQGRLSAFVLAVLDLQSMYKKWKNLASEWANGRHPRGAEFELDGRNRALIEETGELLRRVYSDLSGIDEKMAVDDGTAEEAPPPAQGEANEVNAVPV